MEKYRRLISELKVTREVGRFKQSNKRIDLNRFIFSRNAPANSLEAQLLDQLVAKQKKLEEVSASEDLKVVEEISAVVDDLARQVYQAHRDFVARGKKYITPEGEIID